MFWLEILGSVGFLSCVFYEELNVLALEGLLISIDLMGYIKEEGKLLVENTVSK